MLEENIDKGIFNLLARLDEKFQEFDDNKGLIKTSIVHIVYGEEYIISIQKGNLEPKMLG